MQGLKILQKVKKSVAFFLDETKNTTKQFKGARTEPKLPSSGWNNLNKEEGGTLSCVVDLHDHYLEASSSLLPASDGKESHPSMSDFPPTLHYLTDHTKMHQVLKISAFKWCCAASISILLSRRTIAEISQRLASSS